MLITCPNCSAEYEVPAPRLSSGRKVRCVRCASEWRIVREPAVALREHADGIEPGAAAPVVATERSPQAASTGPRILLRTAWVLSIAFLVFAIAAVIIWRSDIVRAWPPSARLLGQTPSAPAPTADNKPR